MKKTIIRLASVLLVLVMLLSLCACSSSFDRKKEELGVSFDNIICQYSYGAYLGDNISTNITFYADNTVRLWTSEMDNDTVAIAETTLQITEQQKADLLEAIRKNNLLALSNCSNYNILDGGWGYIIFYDADGNEVHHCGGSNPSGRRYNAVRSLIREYCPYGRYDITELEAAQLCDFIRSETGEVNISCDKYVFTHLPGYTLTVPYCIDDTEYNVECTEFRTLLPDGTMEITITASSHNEELGYTITKEVTEIIDIPHNSYKHLIDVIIEYFGDYTLCPVTAESTAPSVYTTRLMLYNDDGEHIFNYYSDSSVLHFYLTQAFDNVISPNLILELEENAAELVLEEIYSLNYNTDKQS